MEKIQISLSAIVDLFFKAKRNVFLSCESYEHQIIKMINADGVIYYDMKNRVIVGSTNKSMTRLIRRIIEHRNENKNRCSSLDA